MLNLNSWVEMALPACVSPVFSPLSRLLHTFPSADFAKNFRVTSSLQKASRSMSYQQRRFCNPQGPDRVRFREQAAPLLRSGQARSFSATRSTALSLLPICEDPTSPHEAHLAKSRNRALHHRLLPQTVRHEADCPALLSRFAAPRLKQPCSSP